MQIILLGTAAGGGVPQWNCWCPTCRTARADPGRVHPRTQSSIAVSPDGIRWFLVNASPDVRDQLTRLSGDRPVPAATVRHVPIEAVLLTDAELDHSLGIVLLREARSLALYATDAVARVLEHDSRVLPTTRAFATVTVSPLPIDHAVALRDRAGAATGLTAEAFVVRGDPPRFASDHAPGHTVGLVIRDSTTGGSLAYVPGCGAMDDTVVRRLRAADAVLFDGTFWRDDELSALGVSPHSARSMGHVPIDGPDGSLAVLATLPAAIRVYTHINNSNPVLIEDSVPRATVQAAGLVVGDDGLTLTV
jgi:pyrroloquinoline quinone biosynthesis protein B